MEEDLRYSSNGEKGSCYLYEPRLADGTDWCSRTHRPSVASRLLPLRLRRKMKWCKTRVRLTTFQGRKERDRSQGGEAAQCCWWIKSREGLCVRRGEQTERFGTTWRAMEKRTTRIDADEYREENSEQRQRSIHVANQTALMSNDQILEIIRKKASSVEINSNHDNWFNVCVHTRVWRTFVLFLSDQISCHLPV